MFRRSDKKELRNYLFYVLIVLFTIALLIYFRAWYKAYVTHQLTIPVINEYLNEVKYEELNNYIDETPKFGLYMCTSNEEKCRSFEKQFKKLVRKYNLKDQIVYLNLNTFNNGDINYSTLLSQNSGIKALKGNDHFFESYPTIAIFNNKELSDSIVVDSNVTIDDVSQFLEEHEIIIKH
jgi:hypothetical protein